MSPKRNGRWRLEGDLDAETARVIANELRRLAEAHRGDDNLSLARRTALALLDMARRSVGFTFIRRPNGQLSILRPDGTPLPWPGQKAA